MPLDDRLRTGLRRIADEVEPDVEPGLRLVLAARPPSPMRRAGTLLAYAAAVGLGIAVVGLGASSLLDRNGVGTSPSPTASAEAGSASPNACPDPQGGNCVGALEPGAHRSGQFIPPFDYGIPADAPLAWDNPEDLPGTFTLHPAGPRSDAIFFFRDMRVVTAVCIPQFDESVGVGAAEIAAWMEANPNLTATPAETVRVGGLVGVQLDIAASGAYTTVCPAAGDPYPAGLPLVPLFAGAGSGEGLWFVGGDEGMRLYLLDMPGGGNLIISVDAIAGDLGTLLEVSQPVIDSITFDPDYY
ncbi:MAG: hypothetical protein ABIQ05_03835 [Candidatus Limnocylindria bacterium]